MKVQKHFRVTCECKKYEFWFNEGEDENKEKICGNCRKRVTWTGTEFKTREPEEFDCDGCGKGLTKAHGAYVVPTSMGFQIRLELFGNRLCDKCWIKRLNEFLNNFRGIRSQ